MNRERSFSESVPGGALVPGAALVSGAASAPGAATAPGAAPFPSAIFAKSIPHTMSLRHPFSAKGVAFVIAAWGGPIALFIGILGLVGLALNLRILIEVIPGMVMVKPWMAIGLVLLAGATMALRVEPKPGNRLLVGRCLAATALLIGLIGGVEVLFGIGLYSADGLWSRIVFMQSHDTIGVGNPAGSVGLMLIGLALLLLDKRWGRLGQLAQYPATIIGCLSLYSLLTIWYTASGLEHVSEYFGPSVLGAIGFFILSLAVLCARAHEGWMSVFTNQQLGGVFVRRLCVPTIAMVLFFGWLRVLGQLTGVFSSASGESILSVAYIAFVMVVSVVVAAKLERTRCTTELTEMRLRMSVQAAGIGWWHWDLITDVISGSQKYMELFRLKRDVNLSLDQFLNLLHTDDRGRVQTALYAAIKEGVDYQADYRVLVPEGGSRWVAAVGRTTYDEHGRAIALDGVVSDITERMRVEEEIQRARDASEAANHAKSDFLASMSHELRTPLNGVIGMTELLLTTTLDPRQHRYAEVAKAAGDALLRLITDVLDFSSIEAGKFETREVDVDVLDVVEAVAGIMAFPAEKKGLELMVAVESEIPPLLRGDPDRLHQIITNLVGNAIKFTDSGEVVIGASLLGQTATHADVRFSVRDTGVGIRPEDTGKIFEAFDRGKSPGPIRPGTGLGLSISKRIVELMGGTIGLDSTPEKGSCFWFTIKFKKSVSIASDSQGWSEKEIPRGLFVLIVDDNATNRELLVKQLNSWSCITTQATDGESAIQMARALVAETGGLSAICVDMQMPGIKGEELIQRLRNDVLLRHIPIIAMTTIFHAENEIVARALGVCAVMAKPVRRLPLREALRRAVAANSNALDKPGAEIAAPDIQPKKSKIKHVLVVDDDEICRELVQDILESSEYRFTITSSGQEALDALAKDPADLVLMDFRMPDMDGFEASRKIRELESEWNRIGKPRARVPIVALTASAIVGDEERSRAAGMDAYITKPITPRVLLEMIDRVTNSSTSGAESLVAAPDPPAIDAVGLLTRWSDNENLILRILRKFEERCRMDVTLIEGLAASNDLTALADAAHKLKGSAGTLYAHGLYRATSELEKTARSGKEDSIASLVGKVKREADLCAKEIPAIIARMDKKIPVPASS